MTDRERWDLRGPVRSCRVERVLYSRRCGADACNIEERRFVTNLDFRPDGALARQLHGNPDGSEWTTTYAHDDTGRLTRVRTENAGGITNLHLYEYDSAGRLLRVSGRNGGGDERLVESYEYDASGCKTKTFHVDIAAQRPDTQYAWSVEGTDSSYSAPGAAKLVTIYNEREQPVSLVFHDFANRELSRVEFRYDDAGQLIEEAQTTSEEGVPREMLASLNPAQLETVRVLFGFGSGSLRRTHSYDGRGRRIETCSVLGPLGFARKVISYNEQGDPLVEIHEHEEREVDIDDQGRIAGAPTRQNLSSSEARFRYEYDSNLNWVSKMVEGRAETADEFMVSAMEKRTITYFAGA